MSRKLELLVIHCTATPDGRAVSSDDIRKWHTSPKPTGRGWSRVGYSDMIHLNGWIENLREYNHNGWVDHWEVTNGAKGHNHHARHVVYVGGISNGKPADTRLQEQYDAMEAYVKYTLWRYPQIKIAGHNQLSDKACPSFDVAKFCRMIGIPERNIYNPE